MAMFGKKGAELVREAKQAQATVDQFRPFNVRSLPCGIGLTKLILYIASQSDFLSVSDVLKISAKLRKCRGSLDNSEGFV